MKSSSLDEDIEAVYFGTYTVKDGKKYIIYKEYEEGIAQNYTLCIIKIENDKKVTLTKNKKGQSKIILEKAVRHYSPYYTDIGSITLSVYTHGIEDNLSEFGGELGVKYSISVNGSLVNNIEITVIAEKIEKKQED